MKYFITAAIFSCLLRLGVSDRVSDGNLRNFVRFSGNRCPPDPDTVPNFDAKRYEGRWFQAEGLPTFFSPSGSACIAANYALRGETVCSYFQKVSNTNRRFPNTGDGKIISLRNSAIIFGKYVEVCGDAIQVNPDKRTGKLEVTIPPAPGGSYASVYSCDVINGKKTFYIWILTREQFPSSETLRKGREEFIKRGIDTSKLEKIPQGSAANCIYEPDDRQNCILDPSSQTNPFAGFQSPLADRGQSQSNFQGPSQFEGFSQNQMGPPLFVRQSQGDPPPFANQGQGGPPPFVNQGSGGPPPFVGQGKGANNDECPAPPQVIQNFDIQRYQGRWYQYEGIPTFFSPSGAKCIAANYALQGENAISVRNSQVINGQYTEICGQASQNNRQRNDGNLTVQFPPTPGGSYLLIGTDYTSYACVYSCEVVLGRKVNYAWVLTREQFPSKQTVGKARREFFRQGLDFSEFEIIPQGFNCQYEPSNNEPNCIDDPSRAVNPFAGQGPFSGGNAGNPFSNGEDPFSFQAQRNNQGPNFGTSQGQSGDVLPSYVPRNKFNRRPMQ